MFTYTVTDYDGCKVLEEQKFQTYDELVEDLANTADSGYADEVTTWAVGTDVQPLRVRNGSTWDVWRKQ